MFHCEQMEVPSLTLCFMWGYSKRRVVPLAQCRRGPDSRVLGWEGAGYSWEQKGQKWGKSFTPPPIKVPISLFPGELPPILPFSSIFSSHSSWPFPQVTHVLAGWHHLRKAAGMPRWSSEGRASKKGGCLLDFYLSWNSREGEMSSK